MGVVVERTISLPAELAKEAQARASSEGKTLSRVVEEALRIAFLQRRRSELRRVQRYRSRRARELGIVTDQDLERHLRSK
ncbi:MAG TPA: hypothetical protein VJ789_00125 [Burkholderiales bacterium]|nr:hypothetical protein [Burkholderiales bacterium]